MPVWTSGRATADPVLPPRCRDSSLSPQSLFHDHGPIMLIKSIINCDTIVYIDRTY